MAFRENTKARYIGSRSPLDKGKLVLIMMALPDDEYKVTSRDGKRLFTAHAKELKKGTPMIHGDTKPVVMKSTEDAAKAKRDVYALGGGATALFLLGAPILFPVALASGAGFLLYKNHKAAPKAGVMTPARQKIYETALKDLKDPDKLNQLADQFASEGLTKQADLLRKRATLRTLPAETKKARNQVYKQALKSTNPHGVEGVASAFEGEGATGAAEALRIHAAALRSL